VAVLGLRPDTTYRFRVMWRRHRADKAHFSDVVVARTARTSPASHHAARFLQARLRLCNRRVGPSAAIGVQNVGHQRRP